jgi:hypothetical protein
MRARLFLAAVVAVALLAAVLPVVALAQNGGGGP